jgi:RHS repeat-associated protein
MYDDLNRITAMNAAKASYSYTLSPTGNRTGAVESSGRTLNWSYDGIYRLTNETISLDPHSVNGSAGYGLDPVGNRLNQASTLPGIGSGTFTYDPDDRLNTETYDANGNTLTSAGKTFAYDFENRLKSMTEGTVAVTLAYDADGNRVAKTVNGVTTRYLVDDLNPTGYAQVVEEVTAGAVTRQYTYGLQRISQTQQIANAWTPSFYGYDGAGTVRLLTDSTGTVTDTYDYDAWGNPVNTTGTTPNVYLYRGEQYDADLGLYYLRARFYNSVTGRFVSTDPERGAATDPSTLHRYLYASADPVNRIDATGRSTTGSAIQAGLMMYDALTAGGYLIFMPGPLAQVKVAIPTPKLKCDVPVQRCCRYVDLPGWKATAARACGLQHCWLKTSSKAAGLMPVAPGPLPPNPWGFSTVIKDQSNEKGDCTPLPGVDEKCVNDALQIGKSDAPWYPWQQCNSFIEKIIAQCSEHSMPTWGPYGCPLIGPGSPGEGPRPRSQ